VAAVLAQILKMIVLDIEKWSIIRLKQLDYCWQKEELMQIVISSLVILIL
jgi:hypothetical protein